MADGSATASDSNGNGSRLHMRVVLLIRPGWLDLFNNVIGSSFFSGYNHNHPSYPNGVPSDDNASATASADADAKTESSQPKMYANPKKKPVAKNATTINTNFARLFLHDLFPKDAPESKYNDAIVDSLQVATRKSSIIYSINPSWGGFHIDVFDSATTGVESNGTATPPAEAGTKSASPATVEAAATTKPTTTASTKKSSKKSGKPAKTFVMAAPSGPKPVESRYIADISRELWYLESKFQLAKWSSKLPPDLSPCSESWCVPWNSVRPDTDNEDSEDEELINEEGMTIVNKLGNSLDNKEVVKLVLKLDGASGGKGVFFVKSSKEMLRELRDYRLGQEALPFASERRDFIPNWAIQQYIHPPMLICGNRKFTLRAFSIILNKKSFIHPVYEARAAPMEYDPDDMDNDREADITNGGGVSSLHDRRYLARDVPELAPILDKIHGFVAGFTDPKPKGRPVLPEDDRWKDRHKDTDEFSDTVMDFRRQMIEEFGGVSAAVVAHDIMVDKSGRLYLLETNHSPAAPPDELEGVFGEHLDELIVDFVRMLLWGALNNDKTFSLSPPPSPWLPL